MQGNRSPSRPALWLLVVSLLPALIGCDRSTDDSHRPRDGGPQLSIIGGGPRGVGSTNRGQRTLFEYREGAEVGITVFLQNVGTRDVSITGVKAFPPDQPDLVFSIEATRIEMGERINRLDDPTIPFRPFVLEPGDTRTLVAYGRFDDCEHNLGSSSIFETIDVRYRTFWGSSTTTIRLGQRYEVPLTKDTCPAA